MIWPYGFCSERACVTSAHISLAKASHVTESNAGCGILFLPPGDTAMHTSHGSGCKILFPGRGQQVSGHNNRTYRPPSFTDGESGSSPTDGETEGQINKEINRDVNGTK